MLNDTMTTSRYSEPRYAKWTAPREGDVDAGSYDGRWIASHILTYSYH